MLLELSVFYRQAATALGAGIPLTQGLRLAASGCRDPRLKQAAEDVERRVRGGGALGPALAAHPEVFRDLDAAIVAAGEEHGRLDGSLLRLAERYEREHGDRQRVLLALLYPAVLFVAALFLPHLHVWVTNSFGAWLLAVARTVLPFLAILAALAGAVALFRRRARGPAPEKKIQTTDYGFHPSGDEPAAPKTPTAAETEARKKARDYGFKLD